MAEYPYPQEPTTVKAYRDRVEAEYLAVGRFLDPADLKCLVHFTRYGYSCRSMPEPQAANKHIAELHAELNPPPPPVGRPIVGQLRVQGQAFADDRGLVLPLLCHFGEAFSAYTRRPEDVGRQLDAISAAGYQGIRFWDVLGYYPDWRGREITPITFTGKDGVVVQRHPQYYDQLAAFLRACQARGLVVQHSRGDLNAWTWSQIQQHCALVGDVQRSVGLQTIAFNEACNESWQNGVPEPERLKAMIDLLNTPSVLSGSSAADDGYGGETVEAVDEFTLAIGMDAHVIHGYRNGTSLDRIRHIYTAGSEALRPRSVVGWQGEPAGPGNGVTVGKEEHPEALCLMAVSSLMTRQGWVYMSGFGVYWNGPIETMPGFYAVPRVREYLPTDLMTWPTLIHGGNTWRGMRVLAASEFGGFGSYRADHLIHADGRQFLIEIYSGEPGVFTIPVERSFTGEIITPHTGERHPFSGQAGSTVDVSCERGRVVRGRLT